MSNLSRRRKRSSIRRSSRRRSSRRRSIRRISSKRLKRRSIRRSTKRLKRRSTRRSTRRKLKGGVLEEDTMYVRGLGVFKKAKHQFAKKEKDMRVIVDDELFKIIMNGVLKGRSVFLDLMGRKRRIMMIPAIEGADKVNIYDEYGIMMGTISHRNRMGKAFDVEKLMYFGDNEYAAYKPNYQLGQLFGVPYYRIVCEQSSEQTGTRPVCLVYMDNRKSSREVIEGVNRGKDLLTRNTTGVCIPENMRKDISGLSKTDKYNFVKNCVEMAREEKMVTVHCEYSKSHNFVDNKIIVKLPEPDNRVYVLGFVRHNLTLDIREMFRMRLLEPTVRELMEDTGFTHNDILEIILVFVPMMEKLMLQAKTARQKIVGGTISMIDSIIDTVIDQAVRGVCDEIFGEDIIGGTPIQLNLLETIVTVGSAVKAHKTTKDFLANEKAKREERKKTPGFEAWNVNKL